MPNYLIKQLQQIQNCATGNVLSKYVNAVDFVNLNWLPILEGIEYNISKLTCSLLNNKNWPFYLPVERAAPKRIPHLNNSGPCADHDEKYTFQDQAKKLSTNCQLIFHLVKEK